MDLKLKGKTGHTFGRISHIEFQRGSDAINMKSICKTCKEKLNLNSDKFQNNKVK